MKEFERTYIRDVSNKINAGVGFVVGGHNYGRVDRMSEDELTTVALSVGRLIEEAGQLLDAIGLVGEASYSKEIQACLGQYAIE